MNITNLRPIMIRRDFENWEFELNGVKHKYVTSITYSNSYTDIDYKPYTRIAKVDDVQPGELNFDIRLWDSNKSVAAVKAFLPLKSEKDIEKVFKLALIQ